MLGPEVAMGVTLRWAGGERFSATTVEGIELALDGSRAEGASPMDAVLAAVGACMGIDVVDILRKGRSDVTGCVVRASGVRREDHPRRFTSIALEFELTGRGLSRAKVERAVELSKTTYCSVWHSLGADIERTIAIDLREADPALAPEARPD